MPHSLSTMCPATLLSRFWLPTRVTRETVKQSKSLAPGAREPRSGLRQGCAQASYRRCSGATSIGIEPLPASNSTKWTGVIKGSKTAAAGIRDVELSADSHSCPSAPYPGPRASASRSALAQMNPGARTSRSVTLWPPICKRAAAEHGPHGCWVWPESGGTT